MNIKQRIQLLVYLYKHKNVFWLIFRDKSEKILGHKFYNTLGRIYYYGLFKLLKLTILYKLTAFSCDNKDLKISKLFLKLTRKLVKI